MWVSWVTGDAQIGLNITKVDPSTVASEVWYGKESGKYSSNRTGVSTVYSQLYPFEGLENYTSGIIHHVRLDGLEPGTKYYYKCGESSSPAMSEEHVFETLPRASPNMYPRRIAVVGDLGLTSNSTTTIDHLIENDPSNDFNGWRLDLRKSVPYDRRKRSFMLLLCIPKCTNSRDISAPLGWVGKVIVKL